MKHFKLISVIAILLSGLVFGCNKGMDDVLPMPSDLSALKSAEKSNDKESKGNALEVVNLGVAGDFVILSKTGITSVYKSSILGDIGTSPITGAAMTLSCGEVTGSVFSVD